VEYTPHPALKGLNFTQEVIYFREQLI